MSSIISKIRLINFKRFRDYTLTPNERMNILVGDNEVGKSTVLEAINMVASGNIKRIESIGLDRLFNIDAVHEFNIGKRTFEDLPNMIVELYLKGDFDFTMNGKNNSDGIICDGIRMVCSPNEDYQSEITEALNEQPDYFPYDYYTVRFSTFADEGYTGYKKKIRSILIDSTNMNSDYATNDFVKRMYLQYTEANVKERSTHKSKYRQMKNKYCSENLGDINGRVPKDKKYTFGLKSSSISGIENDLMIYENEISIDSKGTGKQVFIKTDFALEHSGANIDVILIEEPENHLSHVNLRKLIQRVSESQSGQLFITTHNSLISTRLELNNLLIMHNYSEVKPTMLKDLTEETAKYFMKVPPVNVIEFVLSEKSILVEGPSEYMLFERFYETVTGTQPETDNVQILDVRGLSFKRYLEIACLTNARVAVVTDNDEDAQKHCIDKYNAYATADNIKINFEPDNSKRTFEVVLYNDNVSLCDALFGNDAQNYMLHNKTEAAYTLLSQDGVINVPFYIKEAIEWIRQ
ncbi:MAG: AAA family ATPase [Fibrobacter sp.]|nr:AAA family ATPase [Fibrobacter sp.]